jgi:hypothetical protein
MLRFVFARGVDLNTAPRDTFEHCSSVLNSVQMCPLIFPILIFILEETHGAHSL